MKKAGQYLLCFMLIVMMVLAVGCGCGAAGTVDDPTQAGQGQTEGSSTAPDSTSAFQEETDRNGNQTDLDVMETTGGGSGSLNGPTEGAGVLDNVLDDVERGADDLLNGAEDAVDGTASLR